MSDEPVRVNDSTAGLAAALAISAGSPWPLGASVEGTRANFALFSSVASRVELCLFDPQTGAERGRVDLPACSDGVWHVAIDALQLPVAYGYRVHGPQPASPSLPVERRTTPRGGSNSGPEATPAARTTGWITAPADAIIAGQRCNPAKLLLDPYARALSGTFRWADEHLEGPHAASDNAAYMVRGLLREPPPFDWGDDRPPRTPLAETVIYEAQVKGLTQRHAEVDERRRGTYSGVGSAPVIGHMKRLGITALSLLPVQYAIDEFHLARRGRVNYWGYNTLGFFTPNPRFASGDPDLEFREMVRSLHAAGIEVLLDVVYNHTAEGNENGPTLAWRGIDNAAYYRLHRGDPRQYENDSGCGNTLNVAHPRVLQMVLDSLRHWVTHYRVDGFRFDLAVALGRNDRGFDAAAPFFQAIAQDPVLGRVKLIAEPWDLGLDGYRLGGFPVGWSEWNDRFRDEVRAFWIQKGGDRGAFARRLAGSSDIFRLDRVPLREPSHQRSPAPRNPRGRLAVASVNYVTAHDGFTLEDLVSYDQKHNEANGEDNRDGTSNNLSWNCGFEGPTRMQGVLARRRWLKRALLAALMLARGVPMLLAGDEIGRTQRGNNNAYCQDNELSWLDWGAADNALCEFVAGLIAVRQRYPELHGADWLSGEPAAGKRRDVSWLNRRGLEMAVRQWGMQQRYVFGMQLASPERRLLALFNAEIDDWTFPLMPGRWQEVFDTAVADPFASAGTVREGSLNLQGCSVILLELPEPRASGRRLLTGVPLP